MAHILTPLAQRGLEVTAGAIGTAACLARLGVSASLAPSRYTRLITKFVVNDVKSLLTDGELVQVYFLHTAFGMRTFRYLRFNPSSCRIHCARNFVFPQLLRPALPPETRSRDTCPACSQGTLSELQEMLQAAKAKLAAESARVEAMRLLAQQYKSEKEQVAGIADYRLAIAYEALRKQDQQINMMTASSNQHKVNHCLSVCSAAWSLSTGTVGHKNDIAVQFRADYLGSQYTTLIIWVKDCIVHVKVPSVYS